MISQTHPNTNVLGSRMFNLLVTSLALLCFITIDIQPLTSPIHLIIGKKRKSIVK